MWRYYTKHPIFYYALLFVGLAVFLLLSFIRSRQTLSWEELCFVPIVKDVFSTGFHKALSTESTLSGSWLLEHPPLYMYSMLCAFALFGPHDLSTRFVGIFSGILTILLVFLAIYLFVSGDYLRRTRVAALVSVCYALAPTTIQAAALTQIDTSILVPSILCIGICAAKYIVTKERIWLVGLGISFVVSLWVRFSTPVVIITLIAAYFLISNGTGQMKREILIALACGAAVFLLSWLMYCSLLGIPWSIPFAYSATKVTDLVLQGKFSQCAQDGMYLALWLGPVTLLTIGIISARETFFFLRSKKNPEPCSMFLFCGLAILIGYSFLGSTHNGGYPRYYSPVFSFIYIGMGLFFSRQVGIFPKMSKTVIIFLFVFLAQLLIVGDPLYILRYMLREAMVFAPEQIPGIVNNLVIRFLLFFLLLCVSALYFVKPLRVTAFMGFLVVCSLSCALGITISQSLARYHTGFSYGEQGIQEVVRYLRTSVDRDDRIVAPGVVNNELGHSPRKWVSRTDWNSKERISSYAKDPGLGAFIYSTTSNPVTQLQGITKDAIINRVLKNGFEYTHIGTFHVWVRKKERWPPRD